MKGTGRPAATLRRRRQAHRKAHRTLPLRRCSRRTGSGWPVEYSARLCGRRLPPACPDPPPLHRAPGPAPRLRPCDEEARGQRIRSRSPACRRCPRTASRAPPEAPCGARPGTPRFLPCSSPPLCSHRRRRRFAPPGALSEPFSAFALPVSCRDVSSSGAIARSSLRFSPVNVSHCRVLQNYCSFAARGAHTENN